MKSWLSNRVNYIDSQLASPPAVTAQNDAKKQRLTLIAATNATVYYTLDGSDPRRPGGTISTNAILYTGPIELAAGSKVVARARDQSRQQIDGPPLSTPWSSAVRR